MNSDTIGQPDWPAIIAAAAQSPLGIIALIIIAVSIVGYFMLKHASEHYRFIAFLLLFIGGVALGASLVPQLDSNLSPESNGKLDSHESMKKEAQQPAQPAQPAQPEPNISSSGQNSTNMKENPNPVIRPTTGAKQEPNAKPEVKPATSTDPDPKPQNSSKANTASEQQPQITTAPLIEERIREVRFNDRNSHCARPKEINWRVNAEAGWLIDLASIQVVVTVKSSQSQYIGVDNASSDGFNLIGRLVNNGSCVYAFGTTVARDGRGALNVIAKFREYRPALN